MQAPLATLLTWPKCCCTTMRAKHCRPWTMHFNLRRIANLFAEMKYEPQEEAPSVNGNLAPIKPLSIVTEDEPAGRSGLPDPLPPQGEPLEPVKAEPMDVDEPAASTDHLDVPPATSPQPSAELLATPPSDGPGVPCRSPPPFLWGSPEPFPAHMSGNCCHHVSTKHFLLLRATG